MRHEFTIAELDAELVELLPERETLSGYGNFNWANIAAYNSSLALNAGSVNAAAWSNAQQAITVTQGG